MDGVIVESARDIGNDVLVVTGTVDGIELEARGWVSAMTNHFDADAYDEDGNRKDGAQPRMMTATEKRAYCSMLLQAAAPVVGVDMLAPLA